MTVAEYKADLIDYQDFLKDFKVIYLPKDIYEIFENLCSSKEKQCLLEKGLLCLVISEYILFECENGEDFNIDTDAFRKMKEMEKEKLGQDDIVLNTMRNVIKKELSLDEHPLLPVH